MTPEQFQNIKKGDTLVSPLGGYLTAKQNAKGETWKVIIQWSSHTITAETCEKYEVRK